MKTFNLSAEQKTVEQELNVLAVAYANGDEFAGERFMVVVEPLLTAYARKKYSPIDKEDLAQEFMIEAIKACFDYAERYQSTGKNVLGLIYSKCQQRLIDLGRGTSSKKRSLYKDREVSLQALVGEDGDMSMADRVGAEQKSVEAMVMDKFNETNLALVVEQFSSSTKGRNSQIVPLVYKATKDDWDSELLNSEISKVLEAETGTAPTSESIRQAKSRATKALRKAIENGNISLANSLEYDHLFKKVFFN